MKAHFHQTSLREALTRSREEEKAIFAYFYSESRSEQESVLNRVLSQKSTQAWLESNTVPISINVDEAQVITIDNAPLVPWCRFLSPNLRQIGEIYDISQINTESRFITYANHIVNGEESLPYAKKCITHKDTKNPRDWLILARVYSEWGYDIKAEKIIHEWLQTRVQPRHCFSYIQGVFMWGLCYDCFENSDRMKTSLYDQRDKLRDQIIHPGFSNFGKILEFVRLNRFLTEQNNTMDLYESLNTNREEHVDTLNHLMKIEYELFYHKEMFTELFSRLDFISMVEESIVTYEEEKKWILESEEQSDNEISDIELLNEHLQRQLCVMYEILLRNNEIELAEKIGERLLTILPNEKSYSLLANFGGRTGNSLFRSLEYAQKAYDLQSDDITYASSLCGICLRILEENNLKAAFREELKSIIKRVEKEHPSLTQIPSQSLSFESGDKIFRFDVHKIDLEKE